MSSPQMTRMFGLLVFGAGVGVLSSARRAVRESKPQATAVTMYRVFMTVDGNLAGHKAPVGPYGEIVAEGDDLGRTIFQEGKGSRRDAKGKKSPFVHRFESAAARTLSQVKTGSSPKVAHQVAEVREARIPTDQPSVEFNGCSRAITVGIGRGNCERRTQSSSSDHSGD